MKTICGSSCSIIDMAGDFYETYNRCVENKNVRNNGFGTTIADVVNVPAIVNGAFAIELYLKSMIDPKKIENKRIHSLKRLFSFLEEKEKNELKTRICEELLKMNWQINNNALQANRKSSTEKDIFEICLKGISEAFAYWRYIFEKKNTGFGFLNTLNVLPVFLKNIKVFAEEKEKIKKSVDK